MKELKLFIWQGDGISDAYHDDGTLVVLAHTAEEARQIMKDGKAKGTKADEVVEAKAKELGHSERYYWRRADEEGFKAFYNEAHAKYPPTPESAWDGSDTALNREPDQVIELDGPKFVAFNGGGYD